MSRMAAQTNLFRVWNSATGRELPGIQSVQMPDLELGGETISVAGTMGDVKVPSLGAITEQTLSLTFPMDNEALMAIFALGQTVTLDIRADLSMVDPQTKRLMPTPNRWAVTGVVYKVDHGKIEQKASADMTVELTVYTMQRWLNGREVLMLDVFNTIYRVNGRDVMAAQHRNLGL